MRASTKHLAAAMAALVSLPASRSAAQQCSHECPRERRDARGCCPPAAPPTPPTPPAPPAPHASRPATQSPPSARAGGPIAPAFDVGGTWRDRTDGFTIMMFQDGVRVTLVWAASGYRAAMVGEYVTPTVIRGTVRRRVPTGCVHDEEYVLSVTNAREIAAHTRVTTGGCDLAVGAESDTTYERTQ